MKNSDFESNSRDLGLKFKNITVNKNKIIIAHGAKEACEKFSDANIYGSLGMFYVNGTPELPFPFMAHMDKENPVHVLDSHNLPALLEHGVPLLAYTVNQAERAHDLLTAGCFAVFSDHPDKLIAHTPLQLHFSEQMTYTSLYLEIDS